MQIGRQPFIRDFGNRGAVSIRIETIHECSIETGNAANLPHRELAYLLGRSKRLRVRYDFVELSIK